MLGKTRDVARPDSRTIQTLHMSTFTDRTDQSSCLPCADAWNEWSSNVAAWGPQSFLEHLLLPPVLVKLPLV